MACVERTCSSCKQTKPISDFYKRNNRPNGYQHHCKACSDIRTTGDKNRKREYDKNYYRKKNYGISFSQYEEMVAAQNGVCAICKRECNRYGKLSIDHSHISGKIRGLLCHKCNNAIGLFGEDITIMQSAIDYLKSC